MTVPRPPRFYLRPSLRLIPKLVLCWLRGHDWLIESFGPDRWGTWPFECRRCEQRCRW